MDAQTRVVSLYLNYVKHWLISADVSVGQGQDIALLAFDSANNRRHHIEVEIGRTPIDEKDPAALGEWLKGRFSSPDRDQTLIQAGFAPRANARVLVSRHASTTFRQVCAAQNVELWLFSDLVAELRLAFRNRLPPNDVEGRVFQLLFYPPKNAFVAG